MNHNRNPAASAFFNTLLVKAYDGDAAAAFELLAGSLSSLHAILVRMGDDPHVQAVDSAALALSVEELAKAADRARDAYLTVLGHAIVD